MQVIFWQLSQSQLVAGSKSPKLWLSQIGKKKKKTQQQRLSNVSTSRELLKWLEYGQYMLRGEDL